MSEQSSYWRCCGAWLGGTIAALALSPNFTQDGLILAATAAGLYRSTDGSRHWQRCSTGLSDPRITALVFAPRLDVPVAFAATADGRLFHTTDGGALWQECVGWAGLGLINAIVVSPNFAIDQTLFVATPEGIFRSQDNGGSWESSTFGLLDLEILCLACAPNFAESEVLWAGSALGGLYRSRNAARSWRESGQGLPDMAMQCIAVSPTYAQEQTLYVGTERDGIYRSTDGGASWQLLSPHLAGQSINAVAITPNGQTIFAAASDGVYCSTDGGQQWTLTANGSFLALSLAAASDNTAVAGTYQEGIFCLSASDSHWQPASEGLTAHVPPVALYTEDRTLYLLDIEGALVQSKDEGRTWRVLNHELAEEPVLALALSVGAQCLLFCATEEMLYVNQPIPESVDVTAWRTSPLPTDATSPTLLACSFAFAQPPALLLADAAGGLYHSADGGKQWAALPVPWPNSQLLQLSFSPVDGANQTLYALTAQPNADHHYLLQLWQRSGNGGEWRVLADFYADTPAAVMTLPRDPIEQAILVGVGNRLIKIYLSAADLTWAVQQQFLANTFRITSIVTTDNYIEDGTIYVTTNHGIWQSRDAGATWKPVGEGLAERTMVAFFPGTPAHSTYAVELGGAIWRW